MTMCKIEGCEKPPKSRGWCQPHYARWWRCGDPEKYAPAVIELCTVEGCDAPHVARGYCNTHWKRWRSYGDPTVVRPRPRTDPAEFFARNVDHSGSCAVWTGRVNANGYGTMKRGGRSVLAHRYSWEQENGPIPDGAHIDHVCHNPACVNVAHLRLATSSQNARNRRGANSGRSLPRNVYRAGYGTYRVVVTKSGTHHIERGFRTPEEASARAAEMRAHLFGDFAGKG